MTWHVYIARCGDGSLYTGISTDPRRRIREHNAGRGSKYVRRKGGALLVYFECRATKSEARRRELEIKSWSRRKKLLLIQPSLSMPEKGYEFFDHTADIGIRAQAETLAELCVALAQGLVELIAEDSTLSSNQAKTIDLTGEDASSLVLKWLKELLFWFSAKAFLPASYELSEVSSTHLKGILRGERFDPRRHVQGREVKAITQHQLIIEQRNGRWFGQVIVDI